MKELSRCSDLNKVARLVLVRYQNVGEVIKGCLFSGDTYICDTAEAKSFQDGKPVPKGSYRIKMRKLPRVSLGSGYYRKGEDRLYLGLPRQQYSVCCITDDAYKPKRGDIGIGFRYGSLKDIKNNFLNESEACRNLLAKIVRTMDCVIFNIVDADERDFNELIKSPLWGQTADISTPFWDRFCIDDDNKKTFDILMKNAILI